ncbi:MAG: hypothetical protein WC781_02445 [Candidatus Pacearchaeota archaeon]
MHYKCENCQKMIQDYWRMIKCQINKKDEIYFCSDSCKEEFEKKKRK